MVRLQMLMPPMPLRARSRESCARPRLRSSSVPAATRTPSEQRRKASSLRGGRARRRVQGPHCRAELAVGGASMPQPRARACAGTGAGGQVCARAQCPETVGLGWQPVRLHQVAPCAHSWAQHRVRPLLLTRTRRTRTLRRSCRPPTAPSREVPPMAPSCSAPSRQADHRRGTARPRCRWRGSSALGAWAMRSVSSRQRSGSPGGRSAPLTRVRGKVWTAACRGLARQAGTGNHLGMARGSAAAGLARAQTEAVPSKALPSARVRALRR
jgi:hypothetical protein